MPSRNRILERKRQQEARKKAKKKSKLEIREPSKQDLEDAKKEEATSKLLKNKPKGGYKDTSPKPKPKPKKKEPSEEDKRIGKELAAQFKKDDAEIAAARKKEKLKIKGKGPVASGKEYGKHLDKRAADKEAKERKDWLDKTRNSPAANAGFDDDERWALQKKHRAWKEERKNRKKNTRTTTKESRKSYATMTKAQRKRARR